MIRHALALPRLPPRVAWFYLRALRSARSAQDQWTLDVVTRPAELAALLRAARGRRFVVEVGTASAWTACALALADRSRRVLTLDVQHHRRRDRYLELVDERTRSRIDAPIRSGDDPPDDARDVELLFIDGAHDERSNVRVFEAWRPRLADDAVVLFHDYGDPAYPGVEAAVRRLGLDGTVHRRLFAHYLRSDA